MNGSFIVDNFYLNNKIFDLSNKSINRDNCMKSLFLIKELFNKNYIDFSTYDINKIDDSDFVLYLDVPPLDIFYKTLLDNKKKRYLILLENGLYRKENFDIQNHKYFNKIFTFFDPIIDNKKYFKINYSFDFPDSINKDLSKKTGFCTIIAGNKKMDHPLELYSKRLEIIRWFEKNHPEEFDLYGIGWDLYNTTSNAPKFYRLLRKLNLFKNEIEKKYTIKKPVFPSYKGKIESKNEVLQKYKFCISYENTKDIPGYITEKVFDSLIAGCIPVYWGANNIIEYIPENCFIDKRNFDSYEELFNFMKNITDEEYKFYLGNIEKYFRSNKIIQFTNEYFADTIVGEIIKDFNKIMVK